MRCQARRVARQWHRFDVALTVCTMRYVSDLRIGQINPQHFKFGLSVEQKKYDLAQFLRDRIMTTSDVRAVLDEMEPPFTGYRRTEEALARYIELARTDDGEKLPAVTKPIEPGQSYLGVPRLARNANEVRAIGSRVVDSANGPIAQALAAHGGLDIPSSGKMMRHSNADAGAQIVPARNPRRGPAHRGSASLRTWFGPAACSRANPA